MNPAMKSAFLSGLALALLAGTATADEPQPATRTEVHKACKVVMLTDAQGDAAAMPPHQIMVTSRAVDGGDPTMQVQVMGLSGDDAETIDVNSLAEGETKTFTTKDGREVVVSRAADGVTLSVDGKEIKLPSLANVAVMSAEGMPGHAMWVTNEGDQTTASSEEKQVFVFAGAPTMAVAGAPLAFSGNFDNLKSLEGLDPAVREKVVAALHEILSSPQGLSFSMTAPAPGEPGAPAAVPGQHVVVRRVVNTGATPGSKVE